MPIDREEFHEAIRLVRGDIQGVHERLDSLNGRTRENEQAIAVLKDRDDRGARHGAIAGGLIGGIAGALSLFFGHGK